MLYLKEHLENLTKLNWFRIAYVNAVANRSAANKGGGEICWPAVKL
jgi:hypothetical protein